jgi:hypothetical protein
MPFDFPPMAQNAGLLFGTVVLLLSMWIGFDFIARKSGRWTLLQTFSAALVIFGLLACLAIAAGRSRLPDQEFLSSRYTLESCICLLGVLLYSASCRILLLSHVWCLAAAGYVFATTKEQQVAIYRPGVYQRIEAAMRDIARLSDDEIRVVFYYGEDCPAVRAVTARLRKERLNIFRDKP